MASRRRQATEDELAVDWVSSGEDSDGEAFAQSGQPEAADDEPAETAAEQRLRLAKQYLGKLRQLEDEQVDDAAASNAHSGGIQQFVSHGEVENTIEARIAARLQDDVRAFSGSLHADAASVIRSHAGSIHIDSWRGHHATTTCVALSPDDSAAYSGSKDSSVWWWDVETGARKQLGGRRVSKAAMSKALGSAGRLHRQLKSGSAAMASRARDKLRTGDGGHTGDVLATAVSSDGRHLVTGGRDRLIRVWDTRTSSVVRSLRAHGGAVTSLAFRKGTNTMFSGSLDRTVKVWNMDNLSYLDTLYGHQTGVMDVDGGSKERAVSCGDDKTVRLWKVPEESQLMFRGKTLDVSIDSVRMLNDAFYVSGSQSSSLALWSMHRKKPVVTVPHAHNGTLQPGEAGFLANGVGGVAGVPATATGAADHAMCTWVSSLAVLRNSNLVASGSGDGYVRFWQAGVSDAHKELSHVASVPLRGFVNGMQFNSKGNLLVAAVGPEHRMGRWWRYKGVRHGLRMVRLPIEDVRSLAAATSGQYSDDESDADSHSDDEDVAPARNAGSAAAAVASGAGSGGEQGSAASGSDAQEDSDVDAVEGGIQDGDASEGEGSQQASDSDLSAQGEPASGDEEDEAAAGDDDEDEDEDEEDEEEGEDDDDEDDEDEEEDDEEAAVGALSSPAGGVKRTRRTTRAAAQASGSTPSAPSIATKRPRRSTRAK